MNKFSKKVLLATLATTTFFVPRLTAYAATDVKPDEASNNSITVTDTDYNINGTNTNSDGEYNGIYGGGSESSTLPAESNNVSVQGGNIVGVFGGMSTTGEVSENNVVIDGGTVTDGVEGGETFVDDTENKAGDVHDNTVVINGGEIKFVAGGESNYSYAKDETVDPNDYQSGDVFDNTVEINGGTIPNGVIGGSALTGSAYNNTITINGGTISGDIVGGEVRYPTADSNASGNTINIYSNANLEQALLIGGLLGSDYVSDDNTLNVYGSGITAKNIHGFDAINFYTNDSVINSNINVLTLTEGETELDLDKITLSFTGDSTFTTGDKVNLIFNSNGLVEASSADSAEDATIYKGVMTLYDLGLEISGNSLVATIGESKTTGNIGNVTNSNVASVENISSTPFEPPLDIDFEEEITAVIPTVDDTSEQDNSTTEDKNASELSNVREQLGFEAFMNTGGSSIKTKTGNGSYVKSNNFNYDIGFARTLETGKGKLHIAPLIEYTRGSYDTELDNGRKGEGNTRYIAGGILIRKSNDNGWYYEGSIRAGRAKNEFSSSDFGEDGENLYASYNASAPMFAGHLRIGEARRLDRNNILDVYGIYSYTRRNGMHTHLSSGEAINFSSVDASRAKIGYRLTTRTSKISRVYTGLAYQYDSNSSANVSGDDFYNSNGGIHGSSGMLELGWQIKPIKDIPWMLDIYATGWVGYHKGVSAMAKVKKAF